MLRTLLPLLGAALIVFLPSKSVGFIRRPAIATSAVTQGWSLWLASAALILGFGLFPARLQDLIQPSAALWAARLG